jgi:hypothetical protein
MFGKKVLPVYYLLFRKSRDGEDFFTHALDTICKLLHTMRRPVEGASWPGGLRALSVYPEFSTPLLESKIFFYTERRHRTCYRWAILRISRLIAFPFRESHLCVLRSTIERIDIELLY